MEILQFGHLVVVFFAGLIGEGYATVIGSGGVLIQFVLAALAARKALISASLLRHHAAFGIIKRFCYCLRRRFSLEVLLALSF